MTMMEVVAAVLLIVGTVVTAIAAIGLQRFESVFARMHAASKAVTLGLLLVVAAAIIQVDEPAGRTKLLLAAGLQLVSAPVAVHLLARSAYRARTELNPRTTIDELAGVVLDESSSAGDGDRSAAFTHEAS